MPLLLAVTGASGLLGSALCSLALENGHTVVGIDVNRCALTHENFSFKAVDTTNYQQFLEAVRGCDALIHLAAIRLRAETCPEETTQNDNVVSSYNPLPVKTTHNVNVVSSYNALKVASDLRIERVVQASSVNVIGLAFSRRPKLDYLPLDEKHPFYPEDAYSLSKVICEAQADSFARRYSWMRIASLRFHWILPDHENGVKQLDEAGPDSALFAEHSRDLWGWVSLRASARACLLGLTAPDGAFQGHEAFFIVAPSTIVSVDSAELQKKTYPEVKDIRKSFANNLSFFDCSKAETLLGWSEVA